MKKTLTTIAITSLVWGVITAVLVTRTEWFIVGGAMQYVKENRVCEQEKQDIRDTWAQEVIKAQQMCS